MKINYLTVTTTLLFGFNLISCHSPHEELVSHTPINQEHLQWKTLGEMNYVETYSEELDAWFWQPEFSHELCELDHQEVTISGFLQNMGDDIEPYYLLSAHSEVHMGCCSATLPHEIIELPQNFSVLTHQTGDSIVVKGNLVLNHSDVYRLNYSLELAQIVP